MRPSPRVSADSPSPGLINIKVTHPGPDSTGRTMADSARSREQLGREAFFLQLIRHLKGLHRYAQHLLRSYEALGDLPPGHLSVEDVVDSAVLGAYLEMGRKRAEQDLGRLLARIAHSYVRDEARKLSARRELLISKEEDVPELPPQEAVSELGEAIFEFFEPDEDLKVEDVVPDLDVPTPEQELETADLQQCVRTALAGLPAEWRRALTLRFVQGLEGMALARALGRSTREASTIVDQARAYLRQKLTEAGCSFTPPSGRVQQV